jgi:hypothetical protein
MPADAGVVNHASELFSPSATGWHNAKRRAVPRSAKLQSDRLLETDE